MLGRAARIGGLLTISFGLAVSAHAQQATTEKVDPASVEAIAAAQAELAELDSQRSDLEASIADAKKRQDALRTELDGLEKAAAIARQEVAAAKAAEAEQVALREAIVNQVKDAVSTATAQAAEAEKAKAEAAEARKAADEAKQAADAAANG